MPERFLAGDTFSTPRSTAGGVACPAASPFLSVPGPVAVLMSLAGEDCGAPVGPVLADGLERDAVSSDDPGMGLPGCPREGHYRPGDQHRGEGADRTQAAQQR